MCIKDFNVALTSSIDPMYCTWNSKSWNYTKKTGVLLYIMGGHHPTYKMVVKITTDLCLFVIELYYTGKH